jgi:dTDP-4-amino-4,6-dideoxygalactose transaminase
MIPAALPIIGDAEREAVDRVLRAGMLAQGPEVAAFESEFSEQVVNDHHCIAVNSGTSALHLSLLAAGIGPGDEVIVPSFTFAATANSVAMTGATPVFADVEADYFSLDPEAVKAAITPRTAAVMPVHLYGHPAAVDRIQNICQEHGLLMLEDAAQAHAAALHGRPVGTWGNAGSFSFYPTKNMTSGEGGMVVTSDTNLAQRVRLLRNQGQERRYENEIVGLNNRMTDLHAAIGRVQLTRLMEWTATRQENAQRFDAQLEGVVTPPVAPGATHVYHQDTIRVPGHDRDQFQAELIKRGVGSGVYYPIPNHRLPAFNRTQDLPVTERVAKECLSIPVHPSLRAADLDQIVIAVNDVARAGT